MLLFFSLNYWFQLNRKLGPLSTTVTKVFKDVAVVGFAYLVFYIAFVIGIQLVMNCEESADGPKNDCSNTTV